MGRGNTVSDSQSFAAGYQNTVSGKTASARGQGNNVSGQAAHAEGYNNGVHAQCAHAEGQSNQATGQDSHAEGYRNTASAFGAHVEGQDNSAAGSVSHVEGYKNRANHTCHHVFGKYNSPDPSENAETTYGDYIEIVGNGTADDARSNARTLDWDGNEVLAGKLTMGAGPTGDMDAATKKYVDDNIPAVPEAATNAPEDLGTAAVGSSAKYAKEDHVHKMPSASDVGAAAKSWTQCSGSSTSASQTITYPAEATELLIKAKSSNSNAPAYFCNVPVAAVSDVSIIQIGGYYYSSSDFGIANVNHDATNRTIAFRNLRYAGTTGGTVTVYWR